MANNRYQLTNDVKAGPYQYAFNTDVSMFEYMNAHQPLGLQFNHHRGGQGLQMIAPYPHNNNNNNNNNTHYSLIPLFYPLLPSSTLLRHENASEYKGTTQYVHTSPSLPNWKGSCSLKR